MLLARWGEFMLWVLMPRTEPSADGLLPFQGVCWYTLEMCKIWVVRVIQILILRAVGEKKALLHAIIKRKKLRLSFF